jgi:hypothetical protein
MITVPQGGTVAGRAASVQGLDRQENIGGALSAVGSAVAEKFGQIKAQQRAVTVAQTQLDMTKELGEERLRFEQMTDPAQIETEWPEVEAAIRDKYVNGKDASGQPLLTPQEADALGLTFQELGMKHGFALGERTVKLTQSQAEAAWITARADIATTAVTADPDTMAALIEMGEAAIDRLPGLMPDEKVKQKAALRAEVDNARLTSAIDADPASALAALNAGTYDSLGAETVAARKAAAQGEIARRAAADAKAAEAEATKATEAAAKRLSTIADLTAKGRKVPDRDFVRNAPDEVKALPEWAEAMAAIQLDDELPALQTMTLAELDQVIAAEKNREIVEAWEDRRLTVLEAMREKKATAFNTDPKAAAREAGLPAPDLPDFDPNDPAAFSAALAESISFDGHLTDKGYTTRSAIFDAEEKAALKAVIAPTAEAAPKVALMAAILQGTSGNAAPVLAEIEADPVFRRGLKFLGLTGDRDMTTAILRGQQKIEGKTVTLPSRKEQVLAFDALTGGTFDDAPALKAELMEASLALFADRAGGIDAETETTDGWISDGKAYEIYQQSVQQLLGAQTDRNGGLTIGGLQEVNGGLVVLPIGVPVQEVETTWKNLQRRFRPASFNRGGAADPVATATAALAPFTAASVYGGTPDLGSDPAARLAGLTLQRIGETDYYELTYEQNGRLVTVPEAGTGIAYRFKLADLMREVGQ